MASLRASVPVLLVALALLPGSGCSYFRHVGKDAAEMLHVGVGASLVPGLYGSLQAPLFATSVGYLPSSVYVGSDYGHAHLWRQAAAGVILGGQVVRTPMDADIDLYWNGYLADAYLDQSHYLVLNVVATDTRTKLARSQLGLTKLDVGVHVLFFGAQVGVDFAEIFDFVTGLFGWDLLDDDAWGADDASTPMPPADGRGGDSGDEPEPVGTPSPPDPTV